MEQESVKFSILIVDYRFEEDKRKLLKYLLKIGSFKKMISELSFGLKEAKENSKNADDTLFCDEYLRLIDSNTIDDLFKEKQRYFELYLHYKYNMDAGMCWVSHRGYEITASELKALKKGKYLNYIIAHRILQEYDDFLLTK